jgi:hypothetical protein
VIRSDLLIVRCFIFCWHSERRTCLLRKLRTMKTPRSMGSPMTRMPTVMQIIMVWVCACARAMTFPREKKSNGCITQHADFVDTRATSVCSVAAHLCLCIQGTASWRTQRHRCRQCIYKALLHTRPPKQISLASNRFTIPKHLNALQRLRSWL